MISTSDEIENNRQILKQLQKSLQSQSDFTLKSTYRVVVSKTIAKFSSISSTSSNESENDDSS